MTQCRFFRAIVLWTIFVCASSVAAQDSVIYTDNRATSSTFRDRGPSYAPTYLIYADKQRTADDAKQLIDALGMLPHLDEYKARAFVVGPSNGNAYGPARSRGISEPAAHAPFVEPQDHRRRRRRDLRQQRHLQIRLRGRRDPHLRRHRRQRRHIVDPGSRLRPCVGSGCRPAVHRGEWRHRKDRRLGGVHDLRESEPARRTAARRREQAAGREGERSRRRSRTRGRPCSAGTTGST